jgi:hypothetical protein
MPARTAAEKLARKQALEEKREARRSAKEKKGKAQKAFKAEETSTLQPSQATSKESKGKCDILGLSEDSLNNIICFLPSRDIGALTLSCRRFSQLLVEARVNFIISRLQRPNDKIPGSVGFISMCSGQEEARCVFDLLNHETGYEFLTVSILIQNLRTIVQQAYGGGETKRIRAKGKAKQFASEFVTYARYLEEAVCGYGTMNVGGRKPSLLPPFVNGRFVSVSPEHSLCRVGGGSTSGAGGSG